VGTIRATGLPWLVTTQLPPSRTVRKTFEKLRPASVAEIECAKTISLRNDVALGYRKNGAGAFKEETMNKSMLASDTDRELRNMRHFHLTFPIRETVSLKLSWTY